MIRRVFNVLVVAALALVALAAAAVMVRDLVSFVSASSQLPPLDGAAGHGASEGHIAFAQGGRIVKATGDGGNPAFVTQGPADTAPIWSPDGMQIAFVAFGQPDRMGIFVAKADGTEEHHVAPAVTLYSRLSWSPDGRRLAFRDSVKARQGIYVVNADGSDLRRIFEGNANTPTWSPDGKQIAFSFNKTPTSGGIYVIDPDGSNPRLLIEGRFGELAWSPDSKRLTVRSIPKEAGEELLIVEAESGTATTISTGVASGSWAPSWSPDGSMVALMLADGEQRRLAVMPVQPGGTPRELLRGYSFSTPIWSPDGASLAVSMEQSREGEPTVVRVRVDGSGKRQDLAVGEFPSWTK